VSQLQNEDILFNEDLACFHKAALKKVVVIDQVAGKHELRLEGRPDLVGLLAAPLFPREKNLFSQVGIKNFGL